MGKVGREPRPRKETAPIARWCSGSGPGLFGPGRVHRCGERAAYVVRESDGLERYACPAHATGGEVMGIVEWFISNGLPVPRESDV